MAGAQTRVAEAFAGHLGCAAFRIDLGAMVSKYIGETEKALDAVFAAAATTRGLLLLDEADALIGPRAVVRDAPLVALLKRRYRLVLPRLLARPRLASGALISAFAVASSLP